MLYIGKIQHHISLAFIQEVFFFNIYPFLGWIIILGIIIQGVYIIDDELRNPYRVSMT
jgi:hypothetical protein